MDRRGFLKSVGLAGGLVGAGLLGGCFGEPETGPVEIVYGRDSCDYCRMIISDPRFAAEIRRGPGRKVYKFDDVGDAVFFLDEQSWKDEEGVEFWVMNVRDGKTWLDARASYYISGQQSPMAYGFGAVPNAGEGAIDYATMVAKVLKGGSRSRCVPSSENTRGKG